MTEEVWIFQFLMVSRGVKHFCRDILFLHLNVKEVLIHCYVCVFIQSCSEDSRAFELNQTIFRKVSEIPPVG